MSRGAAILRPYFLPHWRALGTAGAATVVLTLAELAQPWPLKLAIDRILGAHDGAFALDAHDYRLLALIACTVLAITVAGVVASYFADLGLRRAG